MHSLERELTRYALKSDGEVLTAPIRDIVGSERLLPCGEGVFNTVMRIAGKPWVIKEGRWHLSIRVWARTGLLPSGLMHFILTLFGSGCLPTKREIRRQYKMYLTFARYFGYFHPEDLPAGYPDRAELLEGQRDVRKRLPNTLPELERYYRHPFPSSLHRLLNSDVRMHSFLPREYLLFGTPLGKHDAAPQTSFLFQEYIEGVTVHDAVHGHHTRRTRNELALFCYLLLLLRKETGLIPDTRPRHPFVQPDWLMFTDNVVLSKRGLTVVDTRWFWEADANFVRRGFFLPEWIQRCCIKWLESLLRE